MSYFDGKQVPIESPVNFSVNGIDLLCLVCENSYFWSRTGRLESAGLMSHRSGMKDPYLTYVICASCGFVHTFAEGSELKALR